MYDSLKFSLKIFFLYRTVKQVHRRKCSCLFVPLNYNRFVPIYPKKYVLVVNFIKQSLTGMDNFSEVAAWILATFKCTKNTILSIVPPSKPICNYRNFLLNQLLQAQCSSVINFRRRRGEKSIGQCLKTRLFVTNLPYSAID